MEKKELEELYEKLSKISKGEMKERDEYLQSLVNGKAQGPLVGYASVDKPWLKYTDIDTMYKEREKRTVYQEIYEVNKNNLNHLAIEYFGAKINYDKVLKNIDKVANALVAKGVKKGDFVTICSTGTPELVYLFYAISKIGAIANFIPPYFSVENIAARINDCNSKYMFVVDKCYDLIKDAIPKTNIEETIVMPFFNSSPLRFVKRTKKIKGLTYWNDFVNSKINYVVEPVPYEPNMPLTLIYSSGSTGDAKSILLTNDSFQESVHAYDACGISMDGKQKYYQLIPPWVSTGLSTSIHLPLSKGASIFMDPRFDKKVFVNNIIKHKINATVATATMYDGFVENKIKKNVDLSFFNNAFEGGEPLKKERKEGIEKVFHEHGSKNDLKIGYGQCESGSGITTQTDDFYRSDESVGIPIPGVTIKIVDENFNELPYGEKGQIVAKTNCAMKEYYNNPKATSEYFHYDKYGNRWSCTGDLGSIDEEGMVSVYGRQSDYTMVNGEKVYNFDVEKVVLSYPLVSSCAVVQSNDGEMTVHIVLKDSENADYSKIIKDIQDLLYETYNNINYVPRRYKFRETIPTSKTSKRDNFKLKAELDGIVSEYEPAEEIKQNKK